MDMIDISYLGNTFRSPFLKLSKINSMAHTQESGLTLSSAKYCSHIGEYPRLLSIKQSDVSRTRLCIGYTIPEKR
jgi:hypothetical protein